jgi:hypothetical protein
VHDSRTEIRERYRRRFGIETCSCQMQYPHRNRSGRSLAVVKLRTLPSSDFDYR